MFAVVGETLTSGKRPVRLERVGRPEIKNMTLSAKMFDPVNRDLEIRDLYNDEDAFNLSTTYIGAYRARFNANLAFWDGLDGKTDWSLDQQGNHPLTELLLADFLVVDMSKPFRETSYFEIEQAMLNERAHATCGGRWLNEDVVDFLLTMYINAGHGPRISDGVDAPIAWSSKVVSVYGASKSAKGCRVMRGAAHLAMVVDMAGVAPRPTTHGTIALFNLEARIDSLQAGCPARPWESSKVEPLSPSSSHFTGLSRGVSPSTSGRKRS